MWEVDQEIISSAFEQSDDELNSDDQEDEDAAIATIISSFSSSTKQNNKTNQKKRTKKKKKQHRPNSLDHLKERVSELLKEFEDKGIFIPPPCEEGESKVWSNRMYGQDKKKQRKMTEKLFLENRITQLEDCLKMNAEHCDMKRAYKK